MKFFQDSVSQKKKTGYSVCGDYFLSKKTEEGSYFIICDGIGSGIYANIAAISCAERLMKLMDRGIALRSACEMVASSMHKARSADIPFSAFSVAKIYHDGRFFAYTYEAPEIVLLKGGSASVLTPRFHTAGYEVIGEVSGSLEVGDSLLLSSDGISQAGMGHGYGMGIGSKGIAKFINQNYPENHSEAERLPQLIMKMCSRLMDNKYEDDATLALLHCREANQISLLTGPPAKSSMDGEYVRYFMSLPGQKIVCGSTTADIVSRELERDVRIVNISQVMGVPPEYKIEGIDITTEGAITLNQVYNILDVPQESLSQASVVEYMCLLLLQADVINFIVGTAENKAHEDLIFKQVGVRIRKTTVSLIIEKLREKGKLVVERYY